MHHSRDKETKTLNLNCSLAESLEIFETWKGSEKNNVKPYKEAREDFCGGSMEDLFKRQKLTQFNKERKILESKPFFRGLKLGFGTSKRRKRKFGEHDGEWDFDRKWETTPYQESKASQASGQILNLVFHYTFSAMVPAAQITKLGALIASITDLIECSGVQCNIDLFMNQRYATEHGNWASSIKIRVKNAGEYMSPQRLISVFNSNYYRRVGFTMMVKCCDLEGLKASYGLGSPARKVKTVEYIGDELHLGADICGTNPNLEKEIIKALSKKIAA